VHFVPVAQHKSLHDVSAWLLAVGCLALLLITLASVSLSRLMLSTRTPGEL
jgi:hypothetical protein